MHGLNTTLVTVHYEHATLSGSNVHTTSPQTSGINPKSGMLHVNTNCTMPHTF
jgi:hypothetical protein